MPLILDLHLHSVRIKCSTYVLEKLGEFNGLIPKESLPSTITGFEGVVEYLVKIGKLLEDHQKVLFIVFDQFEDIFFLPEAIKRILDQFFKIQDIQSNVVLGFAWKTGLFRVTSDIPYQDRDAIKDSSKSIILELFSKQEMA